MVKESTRAKSRGADLWGKSSRQYLPYTRRASFSNPPRQAQTPFSGSGYMRHLHVETRSCMVCKGWIRGGSRGAGSATKCTVRVVVTIIQLPRSTPPCGLRAINSHWQLARPGPRWRAKTEEERGEEKDAGLMMQTDGPPFKRLLGTQVVTVTISAGGLMRVGGRWTLSRWNS